MKIVRVPLCLSLSFVRACPYSGRANGRRAGPAPTHERESPDGCSEDENCRVRQALDQATSEEGGREEGWRQRQGRRRLSRNPLTDALERSRCAARLSGGAILVGFSGGKDALCTADVILRSGAFSRVELFSMYLVKGLECFEAPILRYAERRGVKVHFVPHWDLSRLFKNAVLRPHIPGAEKLRLMKLRDVELALTQEHGVEWFGYGERADDSYARRLYTQKAQGVHEQWKRLWPIYSWSNAHVYAYLKAQKIPQPKRIGAARAAGGSGISLDPAVLVQLKREHPADYRRILETFPWAEAQVFRAERGDFDE